MTFRAKLLVLIAPATLLAGCDSTNYRGIETRHQPVVSRTDYVFDVQGAHGGLAAGEAARLAGWMASLRVGYGDAIALDDPGHSPAVRQEVAAQAASRGLLLNELAPVTAGPITPGAVRVVVSRAAASVPGCPDFRTDAPGRPNFDAHTSANYGCGMQASLAAMVANPIDLVRGQPGAHTLDQQVSSKAIGAYRKAAPSGAGGTNLKNESTGGGR